MINVIMNVVSRHLDKFQDQELEGKRGFAIAALKQVIQQDIEGLISGQQGSYMGRGTSPSSPDVQVPQASGGERQPPRDTSTTEE